jgi:two-component system, chemotaxis family, protein-glutamate methylesterase/glutaminase
VAHRDIVVIGASLGGVEALPQLVSGFPADLDAAVLIVQHMTPDAPNFLAGRLCAAGPLMAKPAVNGEPLVARRIYVAIPDHHLMIEEDRVRLTRGPRESHARPSVDVLFRSAAYYAGPRVIGIVLTGMLDDGTAGLWAIKDRSGIAIVQSPHEARYPSMPRSALRHVDVDYTLALADIPNVLRSLTRERIEIQERSMNDKLKIETRIALGDNALEHGVGSLGTASFYTCPECSGSMVAIEEGSIKRFRCHTGHAHSGPALLQQSLPKIEARLWSALAQAEERQSLLRELAQRGPAGASADYLREAQEMQLLSEKIRGLLGEALFDRSKRDSSSRTEQIAGES